MNYAFAFAFAFTYRRRNEMGAPGQSSGTATLYADDSWSSASHSISTVNWRANYRHDLPGNVKDRATWIAFNLPVGTVMTLTDEIPPFREGAVSDLMRGTGRLVDLIGTGKTETVDLVASNMNDCASTFMWRTVDIGAGRIELYEDINYGGNRTVIFLGEWPQTQWPNGHSMAEWYVNDRTSSAKFVLPANRMCQLCKNVNSQEDTAYSLGVYKSSDFSDFRNVKTVRDYGLNDCVSSFLWSETRPGILFR
jgi:hypothetical protein